MNFHPLLVHFPIAFFTFYSLLELARFPILTRQTYYLPLKTILLFAGVVTSVPTILAGLLVASQFADQNLVLIHETFQIAAVCIFSMLALAYFFSLKRNSKGIVLRYKRLILSTPLVFLLTLLGLGIIMIGSAIGGIIVFGPNLDPFTQFLNLFLSR